MIEVAAGGAPMPRFLVPSILELQEVLLYRPGTISAGFLISRFTQDELRTVMNDKASRVFYERTGDQVIGYLLLTDISEFDSYADGEERGRIHWHETVKTESLTYLYQIGTAPHAMRHGVASKLLGAAKHSSPRGLLADVLVEPVRNGASLDFFKRRAFRHVGDLHLHAYRDFGPLVSEILLWTGDDI
jgi:ribosomal protein S18 acetylase RimI-like enzyme